MFKKQTVIQRLEKLGPCNKFNIKISCLKVDEHITVTIGRHSCHNKQQGFCPYNLVAWTSKLSGMNLLRMVGYTDMALFHLPAITIPF